LLPSTSNEGSPIDTHRASAALPVGLTWMLRSEGSEMQIKSVPAGSLSIAAAVL
jgi:hypothetical protein